jgi:hypothetical protein
VNEFDQPQAMQKNRRVSTSAPSTPLEERMGQLTRVKAKPICEYKNWCEYAALTRISRPKNVPRSVRRGKPV